MDLSWSWGDVTLLQEVASVIERRDAVCAQTGGREMEDPRAARELASLNEQLVRLLSTASDSLCSQLMQRVFVTSSASLFASLDAMRTAMLSARFAVRSDVGGVRSSDEADVSRTPAAQMRRLPSLAACGLCRRNADCFLLCRVASSAVQQVGITFVAEDEGGAVIMASVYNFSLSGGLKELDAVFHQGRLLLWRAPFVKPASKGRNVLLRMDNPRNLSFLDDRSDEVLQGTKWYVAPEDIDANTWKERGNAHIQAGRVQQAHDCYCNGLKKDPDNAFLYGNRCLVLKMLGRFEEALTDANKALALDPSYTKVIARKADILFLLERYEEAGALWKMLNDAGGSAKVARMIAERDRAEYQWKKLANIKDDGEDFDVPEIASFVAPVFERADVPGKGRGLVATTFIAKGQIVFIEPALGVSRKDTMQALQLNLMDNHVQTVGATALVDDLLQRTSSNELCRQRILDLSRADFSAREDAAFATVVREVVGTCAFSVDIFRRAEEHKSALFYRLSMLNHSCDPNCSPFFLGAAVVLSAVRDIRVGEELTLSYICPTLPLEDRRSGISARQFVCTCPRCEADEREADHVASLSAELGKFMDSVDKRGMDADGTRRLQALRQRARDCLTYPDFILSQLQYVDWQSSSEFRDAVMRNEDECWGVLEENITKCVFLWKKANGADRRMIKQRMMNILTRQIPEQAAATFLKSYFKVQ